jgi:hypothetical protein
VISFCFISKDTSGKGRGSETVASQKGQYLTGILSRLLFIGVVAAFGDHREFSLRKMPMERDSLLHLKKKASVGIEHEGGTENPGKFRAEIKEFRTIGAAESSELVIERFSPLRTMPHQKLLFQLRFEGLKIVGKF